MADYQTNPKAEDLPDAEALAVAADLAREFKTAHREFEDFLYELTTNNLVTRDRSWTPADAASIFRAAKAKAAKQNGKKGHQPAQARTGRTKSPPKPGKTDYRDSAG